MNVLKVARRLASALLVIMVVSSCETRNDLFHKFNKAPDVYVSGNRGDFSEKRRECDMLLRHGEKHILYFDYDDDYIQNGVTVEYAVFSEQEVPQYVKRAMDTESRRLIISDELPVFTLNEKVVKFNVKIIVTDYYGDKGEALIRVVNCDNRPPVPSIELKRIDSMEYSISAAASTDPDGDAVTAFEYLIDGETVAEGAGYESSDDKGCYFNPGMAGKKGTYIISTPLTSVKHAFQTTGTHTIHVRAKDSLGLWSQWVSVNVDI